MVRVVIWVFRSVTLSVRVCCGGRYGYVRPLVGSMVKGLGEVCDFAYDFLFALEGLLGG